MKKGDIICVSGVLFCLLLLFFIGFWKCSDSAVYIFFHFISKLTDILKFGVDDLLKDDDTLDTDIDFTKMLGPSVNGEWQVEEEVQEKEEETEGSDVEVVL